LVGRIGLRKQRLGPRGIKRLRPLVRGQSAIPTVRLRIDIARQHQRVERIGAATAQIGQLRFGPRDILQIQEEPGVVAHQPRVPAGGKPLAIGFERAGLVLVREQGRGADAPCLGMAIVAQRRRFVGLPAQQGSVRLHPRDLKPLATRRFKARERGLRALAIAQAQLHPRQQIEIRASSGAAETASPSSLRAVR
jgi:hypothetical protein